MKHLGKAACALTVAASMASAGGIERRGDPSMILFEEGKNYLEFSAASVSPNVSGTARPTAAPVTRATGNILNSYETFGLGYKHQYNDKVALAFVIDEPVGASVNYTGPAATLGGPFFGTSNAEVSSVAFTAMTKYQINERFSIYGGLRYQGLEGSINVISPATGPAPGGVPIGPAPYALSVDKDYQFGYLLGGAFEIPDIAMRFAVTYESEIEHDFADNNGTPFKVKIPQAVTIHAQSGIAANTLLFGSIKWREWTEFTIQPADFLSYTPAPVNSPIASEPNDIWTYELGIGRRFNENWSGAAILGYEKDEGDPVGNLSGRDGYISYGLAATYETDAYKVTFGVRYIDVGSAITSVSSFSDNDAIAAGIRVGFKF